MRVLLLKRTLGFKTLLKINIASSFLITTANLLMHCFRNPQISTVLHAVLSAGFFGGFSSFSALVVNCM
ncbi:MAG: hypothetical protein LBP35_02530 [Candidatus Ancillula trichonymphae]|nr:hypothetical protein [Candidatus Ancillula trichonymphae]